MTKKSRRVTKARRALLALSLVLVTMMVTVGGTVAWLTADTTPVVNTFAPSDINIELKEHKYDAANDQLLDGRNDTEPQEVVSEDAYKMVPGDTLPKDPFVRVKGGSESCYIFVKVEENNWSYTAIDSEGKETITDYLSYVVDANWQEVTDGVYGYKTVVAADDEDQVFYILANNQVQVNKDVTKTMMNAVGTDKPTLTFTAYAIQSENLVDADNKPVNTLAEAWKLIGK